MFPIWWLARPPAFASILNQYSAMLASLEELAHRSSTEIFANARGHIERFQKGTALLNMKETYIVLQRLEQLNMCDSNQSTQL